MQAIAVIPKKHDSVHLAELEEPQLGDVRRMYPKHDRLGDPEHAVKMRVLKVGVDATDREINEAKYGAAPPGYSFLVLGHEFFGQVVEIAAKVKNVRPGDYVTCTVRRPGTTIYDVIGTNDMTKDETYYERGINLLHGYLTEVVVDHAEFVVKMPIGLTKLHVLAEPMSCATKAVVQAYEVQRRMRVWEPERAFVLGAGQIGLLSTLILRLRGLEVFTIARKRGPHLKSQITEGFGATYVSTEETSMKKLAEQAGKPDLIIDATGHSGIAFSAMEVLAHNGVLVWTSITGGERMVEVPSDNININWVLGNKLLLGSVNGNRRHFEQGIADMALGEAMYPGVIERILTTPVAGLANYRQMMDLLCQDDPPLKVFVDVA